MPERLALGKGLVKPHFSTLVEPMITEETIQVANILHARRILLLTSSVPVTLSAGAIAYKTIVVRVCIDSGRLSPGRVGSLMENTG